MEALKAVIRQFRERPGTTTTEDVLNVAQEYLQTVVLKLIFQSKFGGALSFMGGTCLRICYDLKRYSEVLDFALDDKTSPYSFSQLVALVRKELQLVAFDVSTNIHEDKVVQKAFLRFSGLPEALELKGILKGQKIHIKLEVDVRPPPLGKSERESFFVNRFGEIFPILKHNLPTLFAGKILALLHRPYARGRDYYDLIWYLSRKTPLNLDYLNRGMKGKKFADQKEVFQSLQKKIESVKPQIILKDIGRFLEDPAEEKWILRFKDLFQQLVRPVFG